MDKRENITQQFSLQELFEISDQMENEETFKSGLDQMIVYSQDLIPDKVDNITRFIEKESLAIETEEEYIRYSKMHLDARKRALESMKGYFRNVLHSRGFDSENRLNGITSAMWVYSKEAVNENITPEQIPDQYVTVTITVTGETAKRILDTNPPVIAVKRTINKDDLKKAIKSGDIENTLIRKDQDGNVLSYTPLVVENFHLKTGKSNRKSKKITYELIDEKKDEKKDQSKD